MVGVTTAGDLVVKFAAYGNTEQARPRGMGSGLAKGVGPAWWA